MNPHIVIDIRMMHHSGIGTYIRSLVPRVIEARRQYRFTLIGKREHLSAVQWSQGPGIQVRYCTAPIYSISEQIALYGIIPRDASVFWAPHYNVPMLHRRRLLVTLHDMAHLARPEFNNRLHRRMYTRIVYRHIRRSADELICVSDFTAREYLHLVGQGRGRLTTIPLGVDHSWFRVEPRDRPFAHPYFLFIGNAKPHKNLSTLLRAFSTVRNAIPHDLVIAGQQHGYRTSDRGTEDTVSALGDRVQFTGFVPHEQLEQLIAFADALIMPSLYEGFGLPPLEAMAASCPVIVARAGSLPEVCGDAALYFDPLRPDELATCMTRLACDEDLRNTLRVRGRYHARRFEWVETTDRTLAVLDNLV